MIITVPSDLVVYEEYLIEMKGFDQNSLQELCTKLTKSKGYKLVMRPAMMYGSDCWPARRREEMRVLRWMRDKKRGDELCNEMV